MDFDIASEIELLRAYDSDTEFAVKYEDEYVEVVFHASPRDSCVFSNSFVAATFLLRIPNTFPDELPEIEIVNVRGLSETRSQRMRNELIEKVREFEGEVCLIAICEAVRDVLDNLNTPEGTCCFCLEGFLGSSTELPDMNYYQQHLLLLPCFHVFHKSCFAQWWTQQQNELNAKEKELIEKAGAGALHVNLPTKHKGAYILHCPVCRSCITIDDLNHTNLTQEVESWSKANSVSVQDVLSPDQLQNLRDFQIHCSEKFQTQMENGGIINESPFALTLTSATSASNDDQLPQIEDGFR